jgi:hypothetical protein
MWSERLLAVHFAVFRIARDGAAPTRDTFHWVVGMWLMQPRELVLGPARTRFNDYVGTVAADDAEVVKDQPSLYELADIDLSTSPNRTSKTSSAAPSAGSRFASSPSISQTWYWW